MIEEWKPIKGYEGLYEVSNFGRVKSLGKFRKTPIGKDRWYDERILKGGKYTNGYLFVGLSNDDGVINHSIHRLVAIAFIENVNNKPCVNHMDCNRTNNNVLNLEWCTYSENIKHSREVGSAKYCYIEKPQIIINSITSERIQFSNTTELCKFFGHTKCWLGNKRKQVEFPILYKGWWLS